MAVQELQAVGTQKFLGFQLYPRQSHNAAVAYGLCRSNFSIGNSHVFYSDMTKPPYRYCNRANNIRSAEHITLILHFIDIPATEPLVSFRI